MNLATLGEFGLIAKIREVVSGNLPADITGIGDDCAVIPTSDTRSILVTTDSLIENTHFLRSNITATALAYKSIVVNLSDIAAMGGTPKYVFLSIGLPEDIELDWLDEFLASLRTVTSQYYVTLMGGDTTRSARDIFINVTVIGEADSSTVKYRSGAKPGDIICVTGNLGDSAAGLEAILCDFTANELVERHYYPRPHIAEGMFLAQFPTVHAMLDLSDGLDSDLTRICEASGCGAEVELAKLPISAELAEFSQQHSYKDYEFAALGGEDYSLLLAIAEAEFDKIAAEFVQEFQQPLTVVGKITPKVGVIDYYLNNTQYKFSKHGFQHFSG